VNNITLIDASCPVVMRLQKDILEGYREMAAKKGQVVIFGKKGHAEVLGLEGQTGGDAIVIRSSQELDAVDFERPIRLYSQTTMDVSGLHNLASEMEQRSGKHAKDGNADFIWKDSICRQVSNRAKWLEKFAARHEVVIFVSGRKSSNGLALFHICHQANPRTYFVSSGDELRKEWFEGVNDAGITGATSTPLWQIECVAGVIMNLAEEKDVPQEIDPCQF
jgi:4-hydroxy-3-methylbut-2-enyl diphosphate reductase